MEKTPVFEAGVLNMEVKYHNLDINLTSNELLI
jgi:hypothetical protein